MHDDLKIGNVYDIYIVEWKAPDGQMFPAEILLRRKVVQKDHLWGGWVVENEQGIRESILSVDIEKVKESGL